MSKHSESYSPRFRFEASTRGLFFCKKNAPQVSGRRSNYAHLTEINIRRGYHKIVKCDPGPPATKKQPRKTTSLPGPTTMLSSLNCPYPSQPGSSGLETSVTRESRITQVFRRGDICCIRIPTQSATTSLTLGTLSSIEPWCIIITDNEASTASDNERLRAPNRNEHTESPVAVGTENSGYSRPHGRPLPKI